MALPVWVLDTLAEWILGKRTGDLETSFRHGEIKHMREGSLRFPPGEPAKAEFACPACHGRLVEQDYGNKGWCAACGVGYAARRRGGVLVALDRIKDARGPSQAPA